MNEIRDLDRENFVKLIVDEIGHGDLEELIGEISQKFMTCGMECEGVDGLTPESVDQFAELLADYIVGPK